jgi:hypothetical protein
LESERSFGALSGGVRSERSGALSEVSFGGGGSVAGVSYARSEGCGASSFSGSPHSHLDVSDSLSSSRMCLMHSAESCRFVRSMISLNFFSDYNIDSGILDSVGQSVRHLPSSNVLGVCGIGVSVNLIGGSFFVASLSPRGAAWYSRSVSVGDRILAINGVFLFLFNILSLLLMCTFSLSH